MASLILGLLWAIWHYPLYVHSVFAGLATGASFAISVVCFTFLMTILFHRTRGCLLLAVLFHWTVNVSPNVAERLLPAASQAAGDAIRPYQLAVVLVVTAIVVLIAGRTTLGATSSFLVERDLAAEAVWSDRPR